MMAFKKKRSFQLQNISLNWIIQECALFDTRWQAEMWGKNRMYV